MCVLIAGYMTGKGIVIDDYLLSLWTKNTTNFKIIDNDAFRIFLYIRMIVENSLLYNLIIYNWSVVNKL